MYATRRLLRAPKGVPGWAQHMAKQPAKAGRLPPQQWANAPESDGHGTHEKVPPTDWKAGESGQGSEARAWEEIRRPGAASEMPAGAKAVPPQEGPYAPKTDRSKGFMDSFRSLKPNQRILIGATLFVFGLGIMAYDSVLKKERNKDQEIEDDLRERLARASAITKIADKEGVQVNPVDIKDTMTKAAESEAEKLKAAEKAVSAAAERGSDHVLGKAVKKAETAVADVVQIVQESRYTAEGNAGDVQAGQSKGEVGEEGDVVNGKVPERTGWFGIRLR
ncbi:hypothetical protein CspeluHIS016_0108920 [Cutaneotrichosporon spelunceum]|uniref:Uncharacterized protein n=1 Tax=Cutaneotrichosporon spelunceum TaxID=1672016 RepID=A0AAD3Y8T6_9TREE|nr:hypothetical protein CspeluHIS016_0108920 [Cutaneotrichosporon spelunceum]